MMSDTPFAYVYCCYDPTIRDGLLAWCNAQFGPAHFIFDADPGAAKNLVAPVRFTFPEMILWKIELAHTIVHPPLDVIVLINHSACGAYAAAGITFADVRQETERHKSDLERAADLLRNKIPGVPIAMHYYLKQEQRFAW
jgi:hypothetical protein